MEAETITIEQFIQKHGILFFCHEVDERPDGLMSDSARHFRCKITKAHSDKRTTVRSFGLYFSQGSAHTQDPTLADVLDCLASDAAGYENAKRLWKMPADTQSQNVPERAFQEWCAEYGYDTDSRRAEKIFKAVKRQAEQLKRTIGQDAYEELLWNVETNVSPVNG